MAPTPTSFIWYELMTTDVDAADPVLRRGRRLAAAALRKVAGALHRHERG